MTKWLDMMLSASAAILLSSASLAATQTTDDPLIGMWGYHMDFPIGLSGELTVERQNGHWRATIGGVEGQPEKSARDITFTFPDGGGKFRGHLVGTALEGFWIRRGMTDDARYAAGATQPYTMPVTFRRASPNAWRGTVAPLPDPFTLYLKISRDSDGTLVAAFRDPEQNSHGPAMQLLVTQQDESIRFSTRPDPDMPAGRIDATFLHAPDRLSMLWKDLNRTIELTRLAPPQSDPFYGRPPGSSPYAYREPDATGDGWKTARAGALGVDEAALTKAVQGIIDIDPAARRHAFQIHSLAVAYKGRLVLDEYFHGFDRDKPHDTRSASKTFASVMLGAAMMQGVKISPETKAFAVLAPLGPFANPDPLKAEITVGDLLSHTSGLECDDNNEKSLGNEDTMQAQTAQPDWWKYTLDLPVAYPHGTRYAYCSANINLVGAVLTVATKTWLPELFERTIARPLQFRSWYWNVMPNGEGYAGGGAFIRTRDFLKLGQAFLDGGVWNGKRIVDPGWVKTSTSPQRRVSPETTGRYGDDFLEVYGDGYDGYAWHFSDIASGGRTYHAYLANGNGGQLLIAVPELDLAVMFTAGNYQQGAWIYLRDAIFGAEIIPAIKR